MRLISLKYYLFVLLVLYTSVKSFAQITITNKGTWIVNAKENILVLCPNHHLKFDKGRLQPEEYAKVKEQVDLIIAKYGER